jgi:hypothetical protein
MMSRARVRGGEKPDDGAAADIEAGEDAGAFIVGRAEGLTGGREAEIESARGIPTLQWK